MRYALFTAALLALGGCASTPTPPGREASRDAVQRSIEAAVQATPARPAPVAPVAPVAPPIEALLPSLTQLARPAPRFDLVLADVPAAQVFQAIAQGSDLSIVVPPSLAQQRVSLSLKEVDAVDALEVLREHYGFEYRVDGRRVHVQPQELVTRIYQVAFPAARRSGRSTTRVSSGSSSAPGAKAMAPTVPAHGRAPRSRPRSTATCGPTWRRR